MYLLLIYSVNLFYVVVYLVIYLRALFLQIPNELIICFKNRKISQEIFIFIYLEKKKSHVTFSTGHGCWRKGYKTPSYTYVILIVSSLRHKFFSRQIVVHSVTCLEPHFNELQPFKYTKGA